ncbi:putative EF-hand domain pair protein [Rosa chinensis]|uniref:Putative EF-hand domain pair protein n=1 Tax=Rosa chinensis TaxID=74649 RepID=A0A2P6Q0F9_ROSCH|nr:putative EF-hand domain pair protein [Rosa chinensis]
MVRDVDLPFSEQEIERCASFFVPGMTYCPEQKAIKKVPIHCISKEQVCDFFKRFDGNGDGKLCKEEIKAAFRKLGSRWSSYRARRALDHADSNGDGIISNEELDDLINYALDCGYKLLAPHICVCHKLLAPHI